MIDTLPVDMRAIEGAFARAQLYGALASALGEPKRTLDEAAVASLESAASTVDDRVGLSAEVAELQAAIPSLRADPRILDREYATLFLKGEVPPFEASYAPGMRLTQELADVAGFFRAFGVKTRDERPDHLVSELELMAFLCLKEAIALGNRLSTEADVCRQAQAAFLRDPLARWVSTLARGVSERATLPVYPILLRMVEKTVAHDASVLGVVPEAIVEVPSRDADNLPRCGVVP